MMLKKSQLCMTQLMMAPFAAMSDVDEGKGKKRLRFNEKLAALRKQLKKKDGEDSDSGSEYEVDALDIYGCKEKLSALQELNKQKKLKKALESLDKKDDGDLDNGSK
jgi:hypothetical protein